MPDAPEIDPEVRTFLDTMRADWRHQPPFAGMTIPERRIACEEVRSRWTRGGPVMARTIDETFEAKAGTMRVRVHLPEGVSSPAPVLIYLHGGGFTLFSIDTHDRLMREYAAAGGFAVIGLDYPLSPEAKYPVAVDCITEFMLALDDCAPRWGVDAGRVALGGDSAGASLSFATFMRLRDIGKGRMIRAILSNYGGFSARISDESEARFGGPDAILHKAECKEYWDNYMRDDRDADDPYACPINADVGGFPPVFLVIPECDVVTEHSLAMEQKLRAAGVPTEAKVYKGATHSFIEAMSISALAREAVADGAAFVARSLAG